MVLKSKCKTKIGNNSWSTIHFMYSIYRLTNQVQTWTPTNQSDYPWEDMWSCFSSSTNFIILSTRSPTGTVWQTFGSSTSHRILGDQIPGIFLSCLFSASDVLKKPDKTRFFFSPFTSFFVSILIIQS